MLRSTWNRKSRKAGTAKPQTAYTCKLKAPQPNIQSNSTSFSSIRTVVEAALIVGGCGGWVGGGDHGGMAQRKQRWGWWRGIMGVVVVGVRGGGGRRRSATGRSSSCGRSESRSRRRRQGPEVLFFSEVRLGFCAAWLASPRLGLAWLS